MELGNLGFYDFGKSHHDSAPLPRPLSTQLQKGGDTIYPQGYGKIRGRGWRDGSVDNRSDCFQRTSVWFRKPMFVVYNDLSNDSSSRDPMPSYADTYMYTKFNIKHKVETQANGGWQVLLPRGRPVRGRSTAAFLLGSSGSLGSDRISCIAVSPRVSQEEAVSLQSLLPW